MFFILFEVLSIGFDILTSLFDGECRDAFSKIIFLDNVWW